MSRLRHLTPQRTALALVVASAVPFLTGCPKKETPTVDAAPPPAPPEEVQTTLLPMEEVAVELDAGEDATVKKAAGPAVNSNVARFKQCCSALAAEAKRMGSSPEAGMFSSAATQCSAMATQVGPSGDAPELGPIRALLAGRKVPAVCAGF